MTTKEPRQDTQPIKMTTAGGVMALPRRAAAWVMPCAQPDLPPGNQLDIARVAVGKVAPSPNPSNMRAATSVYSPPTSPVRMVATDQMAPHTIKVRRAPNRSPNQPPITWHTKYGYAKAENTNPSCVLLSPRSVLNAAAAVLTFTRST